MLKLFKKGAPKPLIESNISSLVHEGDDYFAHELILINEPLNGNLFCAESTVIEHAGVLTGNINSKTCEICGKVNGRIIATEHAVIKNTAVITGAVKAPKLTIEHGAIINGLTNVATDIYAIVNLAEALKNNLTAEKLPDKLKIADQAVAMTPKTDEPAKAPAQKANVAKPAAAAAPATKPAMAEPVAAAPIVKKVVAAAAAKPDKGEEAKPATPAPKPAAPAAAAPPAKNADEDNANGRWW